MNSMSHTFDCRRWSGLVLVAMLIQLVGCGGPTGPVRNYADVAGAVKYKGKPLTMGTVMFQPPTGAMATGDIKPDGTYTLKGVIGPNTVTIISRDPEPDVKAARAAGKQAPVAK